jgi:hypothetical protein
MLPPFTLCVGGCSRCNVGLHQCRERAEASSMTAAQACMARRQITASVVDSGARCLPACREGAGETLDSVGPVAPLAPTAQLVPALTPASAPHQVTTDIAGVGCERKTRWRVSDGRTSAVRLSWSRVVNHVAHAGAEDERMRALWAHIDHSAAHRTEVWRAPMRTDTPRDAQDHGQTIAASAGRVFDVRRSQLRAAFF